MFSEPLTRRAEDVLDHARTAGVIMATAESCTGGLVAGLLTSIAGASDVFERGFVTYSNESKTELLGIPAAIIAAHGAVSAEVASRMATQCLLKSNADIAVSITGIAGPGGSARKPAGLVYFGLALRDHPVRVVCKRLGDRGRNNVRLAAVETALALFSEGVDLIAEVETRIAD
ncbi:CinA family protein [Maricaulis salignorans]|uniref:Nicotinamide-nucleotide amidase n=1 Tax=Maricaulis salignorans TaxID=144026 RepID=A0A1G9NYI6_9PROT|nr:CinA family protein [Maricaulis salignorans]SDL91692.1 nicotinamide-nucleotide amidase [Maricaulis salignorans]